ncbi:glycoside hydrolase family 32 protein [Clostridium vincentii]|uniref:beta-fructofuranosidase n=1 Tax=Clostridium vincentii TaxID=52704 RepID=A0A2T0BGR3_9CLOT|nr:glycoside hydrolase family 32 protein [Clostridium vincentii]PRR83033.1 Sucrose-6-phosphate hydrolase [Clostridium vincentii]
MKIKNTVCILAVTVIISQGILSSNSKVEANVEETSINSAYASPTIFPKSQQSPLSYIGDTMPYYENGKFNIFYLDDIRDSTENGFHPWSLITTENFYDYQNEGVVINHSNNNADQDLALGTGSVIKDKNGLYNAFFTAFNDRRDTGEPYEVIMHATSTDLKNWTKIPEDTFSAAPQYSRNDFRDSYVFYNEEDNKYWMLITTRKDNTGVIARYTSDDLKTWTDQGVLFANDTDNTNLECPQLFKLGDYWYLTFSDQSAQDPFGKRVVHYRIATNPMGPFTKLGFDDSLDGNGLYAGKFENDSNGNVYMFGWNPTKVGYTDSGEYNWGGNLVVHQIKQDADGTLRATPVEKAINAINNYADFTEMNKTQTVIKNNNDYSFTGNGYESVTFGEVNGISKITGKINTKGKNNNFGFMFNVEDNGKAPLNIVFNRQYGRLEFYSASTDESLGAIESTKSLTIGDNATLDFSVVIDDSVAVLYVNNEVAFTTRMYNMQNHKWGIFSMDSDITFSNSVRPAVPIVTINDVANTVTGMATGMEYNLDNAGYVAYVEGVFNAIDFSGDHTLLVRVAAEGINPAGVDITLTFTVPDRANNANLFFDFGVQGNNGWGYGYGTSNLDFADATGYDANSEKYYQPGLDGLEIKSDFVHPAVNKGAVYTWTVGEDGTIDIIGKYTKFTHADVNPTWPDGVKLTIYKNDQKLQEDVVAVSATVDNTKNINIRALNVTKGDKLYFIITANANNAWDAGKLEVSINAV